MIKVTKSGNVITITGHANYSNGEDIVCASVSSIMYTSVNAILRFDKDAIKYEDDGNKVVITINKDDQITNELILNMLSLFKNLESDYKNNIKIESEE